MDVEDFPADLDQDKFLRDVEQYSHGDQLMEKAREILLRSDFNFQKRINERMKGGCRLWRSLTSKIDRKHGDSAFKCALK